MAFVRLARFPGACAEHFHALQAAMGDVATPEGRLVYAAGPTEDGWQVVQIWSDRQSLEAFNERVFYPALSALGDSAFPRPPVVVDFESAIFDSH